MATPGLGGRGLSLRLATVLVLVVIFSLLSISQFLVAGHTLASSLEATERHDEMLRARHVQALVGATQDELKRLSWDNATWDEARNFVLGQNPAFVDVNLGVDTFATHNCDAVAIVATDGTLLAARGFDRRRRVLSDPPADLAAAVGRGGDLRSLFRAHEPGSGFASFGGASYLVGTSPVTHNGGVGDAVGWLVALRRIDADYETTLSEDVGSFVRLTVGSAPGAKGPPVAMPLQSRDVRIDASSDDELRSHFAIARLDNGRELQAVIDTRRTVHAAALRGARLLFVATVVAAVVATLLALWFIENRLLSPLRAISHLLRSIGERTKLSARVPDDARNDEIGALARSINAMLSRIEAHEDTTQRSRDAALTASRVKSEFVARMSHEIRTPMNGVLGMTELLARTELNERQKKFCETIHRSATNLLEIVNDILDFSKMEAGRMLLNPSTFAIREAIEDAVELLAGRAQAKGTELVVAIDPGVPLHVISDPVRLNQILTNLIGNAIKFTEGGEIVVSARRLEARNEGALLQIAVRDTGSGISPESVGRIFESFAQGDSSDELRAKGTGLGLAIAKQLVELMGGEIGVVSELGLGSTFTFTIETELPAKPPVSPPPANLLAGYRVLIAEDNRSAAAALETYLRALGASVTVAQSAAEVVAELRRSEGLAELVLIDHALRDADVQQRLKELRERSALSQPRVVMLSPVQSATPGLVSDLTHVDAYLTRPVRCNLLLATAARLLGAREIAASADPMATGEYSAYRRLVGLRVLVVEDNAVNRDVAVGMLNALGCSARTACDGEEALNLLDREDFDVILMDRQMPRRDGLSTTIELRRRESNRRAPPTPVIALTAHAMPGSREACLKAGMNEFLLKPFALSELSRVLARYARRRGAEAVLHAGLPGAHGRRDGGAVGAA